MKPKVEELNQIRQEGMEKAATIWETLELLPEPVHSVNIYKASCSIKCAEFLARLRDNPAYSMTMRSLMAFLDSTLEIAAPLSEFSNKEEGMRVIAVLEEAMPLTQEVYEDPAKYAMRQHIYDGIIMLAAARMGKEEQTKEVISKFQDGVVKAVMFAQFAESLSSALQEIPEDE